MNVQSLVGSALAALRPAGLALAGTLGVGALAAAIFAVAARLVAGPGIAGIAAAAAAFTVVSAAAVLLSWKRALSAGILHITRRLKLGGSLATALLPEGVRSEAEVRGALSPRKLGGGRLAQGVLGGLLKVVTDVAVRELGAGGEGDLRARLGGKVDDVVAGRIEGERRAATTLVSSLAAVAAITPAIVIRVLR